MKRIAAVLAIPVVVSVAWVIANRDCPCVDTGAARPAPRSADGGTPAAGEWDARPPSLRGIEPEPRVSRSRRNLFAYEMRPVVAAAVPLAAPIVTAVAPIPPRVIETPVPTPPHFPYRYIGRFGPSHDPIAAFVGEGKILTVRPGEKIDDQFVLRAIGIESVEIEAHGWDRRIPIGFSSPV